MSEETPLASPLTWFHVVSVLFPIYITILGIAFGSSYFIVKNVEEHLVERFVTMQTMFTARALSIEDSMRTSLDSLSRRIQANEQLADRSNDRDINLLVDMASVKSDLAAIKAAVGQQGKRTNANTE